MNIAHLSNEQIVLLAKSGKTIKANIRKQYNQVSHLTQDTIRESNKNTRKRHIQEC